MLKDLICKKENTLLKDLEKCIASGYKTYVYGGEKLRMT